MNIDLLQSLTLLFVEDEEELQQEVASNLAPFVKKVYTASNGKEALELFLSYQDEIDIIISDIMMPYLNGIEMVEQIREINKTIPIIFTTAFNENEYLLKTIEQNVSGYILKPIDMEELFHVIEKASTVIENKRLKETLIQQNQKLESLVEQKTKKLQEQNQRLLDQIYRDDLTKLYNRKKLLEDINKTKDPILILVDIDAFKNINDIYGEKFGDLVLKNMAALLQEYIQTYEIEATLYRTSSDHFVLLRDRTFNEIECKQFLERLYRYFFNISVFIKEYIITLKLSITIGVAYSKENTLGNADMALKKAKERKLAYLIYGENEHLHLEYESYLYWTKIVQEAIEQKNLKVFFQPIVTPDGKIIKYEALMRIRYRSKIYPPNNFLDVAKKTKLYSSIEKDLIEQCFDLIEEKKKTISINITIDDINNKEFVTFLKENFKKRSLGSFITFELLESENIHDYDIVKRFINDMKKYGAKCAIDDFGSGYSNFAYLVKLQPDYIKIDGSLIEHIDSDPNARIIVETINDFAHKLGIKTVAEYVHSKKIVDILDVIGVDLYQGFYFGEPQDGNDI